MAETGARRRRSILVGGTSDLERTVRTLLSDWQVATGSSVSKPDADAPDVILIDADAVERPATYRDRWPTVPIVLVTESVTGETAARTAALQPALSLPRASLSSLQRIATALSAHAEPVPEPSESLFGALFDDRTLRWVLDSDGTILRVNDRAAAADSADPIGERLWDGAWWTAGDTQQLKACLETARAGTPATHETSALVEPDARATVDVTIRPAGADRFLATAVDVSERAQLADRLKRSEELHRVTLNNMTDTVLVTDDEGAFTYICPNVHFIFGYTVEEIESMGTVDELLGADLFDRGDLDEAGVLTNIETTTTDKAGREHTLLVNAKAVSIQDGTTLYSCRDITERKRRERAVSVLHDTARNLLYTETTREIADRIINDVTSIPQLDSVALYRYDETENELVPIAATEAMSDRFGLLPSVSPGENDLWRSFLENDIVTTGVFDAASEQLCVPLDEHGVLVFDQMAGRFDDVTIEIAELLAATTEAAFDRVSREARVHERDRRLTEQNERLQRVNEINLLLRNVDQAIIEAESRSEIEYAACERLVDAEWFSFAWIGEPVVGGDRIEPRTWAGADSGYLDGVLADAENSDPSMRAVRTDGTVVVENIAADPRGARWRQTALSYGYQSAASVPIAFDGVTHGVLTVYADRPGVFDADIRDVLGELGETIGAAISADARKEALLGETITVRTYESSTPVGVLGRLSERADCATTLNGVTKRGDTTVLFASIADRPIADVITVADQLRDVTGVTAVSEREDGGILRLELRAEPIVSRLADHGAEVREFVADSEGTTLTVAVSPPTSVQAVNAIIDELIPDVRLRTQREQTRLSIDDRRQFLGRLTARQREVIETAHHAGYFSIPRESSGEAIAETLGISPQAFYRHLRAGQKKLYETVFSEAISMDVE
ncbi:MAG: bacterio-opsin activator domain-containing protein [Halobacteriota archaeon]